MILCGDIGGTHTRLRLTQTSEHGNQTTIEKEYPSQEHADLTGILKNFLDTANVGTPSLACLALAGPVRNQSCKITNLPWSLNAQELQQQSGISHVHLMNDFEAVGYAVEALDAQYLHTLHGGNAEPHGRKVVIGPGTGLGIAFLVEQQDQYRVYPTEGGHVDFAPADSEQIQLLEYWKGKLSRVSVEHLLSGPGLVRIHSYVCNTGKYSRNPALESAMQNEDAAAAVSRFAMEKDDKAAAHALEIFLDILAAQAGNAALQYLSTAGVYLAGGILPKILERLDAEKFMEIFCNKSNMEDLLEQIPVHVITHPQPGLEGTLYYARHVLTP